jgi:uncharacterized membrane protein
MDDESLTDDHRETGRLEAFSDGVFAIAITLLVLELTVPKLGNHASGAALWSQLGRQWPSYVSFITSFATILIMWINHHEVFRLVHRVSPLLLFSNGVLLLGVTIVPFPTAIVGDYLLTPAAPIACGVYAGVFAAINLSYNFFWWSIRRSALLSPVATTSSVRTITRNYRIGFLPYVAAAGLALWSPYVGIGICFCLWILWGLTAHAGNQSLP